MDDIKLSIRIMRPSSDREQGYIGMEMSNMHPLEGERHTRGEDAADGEHSEETLERIIRDIRSYFKTGRKDYHGVS